MSEVTLESITDEERATICRLLEWNESDWDTAYSGHLLEYVMILRGARAELTLPLK